MWEVIDVYRWLIHVVCLEQGPSLSRAGGHDMSSYHAGLACDIQMTFVWHMYDTAIDGPAGQRPPLTSVSGLTTGHVQHQYDPVGG